MRFLSSLKGCKRQIQIDVSIENRYETKEQPTRVRPLSAGRAYVLRRTTRTGGKIGTWSTALN